MPARNTYICDKGHKFEHFRKHGEEAPNMCSYYFEGDAKSAGHACASPIQMSWDCEPGDYFGTLGLIDRL